MKKWVSFLIRGRRELKTMKKRHSKGFKSQVAIGALRGEKTVQDIVQRYEIRPNMVTLWKKQLIENATLAFDKNGKDKELEES